MPGGRPTKYSKALALRMCADLSAGMFVNAVCRKHGISRTVFFLWLHDHPEFLNLYTNARDLRHESMAEEIVEIPDSLPEDTCWEDRDGKRHSLMDAAKVPEDEKKKRGFRLVGLSKEAVMRAQARIDARKWVLARLRPDKYGPKVEHQHTGKDGGPIKTENAVTVYVPDNQRDKSHP